MPGMVILQRELDIKLSSDGLGKPKFDALTSLRFFAAAMIVILHSSPSFFKCDYISNWALGQGVAFFFILSGFILTCVYTRLEQLSDIKQFLLARLSRVWPNHFITACLRLWLFPATCCSGMALIANLLLIQSWIPDHRYYYSLNSVAWSLSCEAFFYFCFVWLIRPRKYDLFWKIVLAIGLFLCSSLIVDYFANRQHHLELDRNFFLYINPLARLSEFIVGMITAKLWLRFGHRITIGKLTATILEIVVVASIVIEIYFSNSVMPPLKGWTSLSYWLQMNGPTPVFAVLIFLAAWQQGYITKALVNPVSIWLGEISYSIYLIHFVLIQYFNVYIPEFAKLNGWLACFIYWTLVILLSHLNYRLIEDPCRRIVKTINLSPNVNLIHAIKSQNPFAQVRLPSLIMLGTLIAGLAGYTALYINAAQERFQFSDLNASNVRLGNNFILEKVSMASANDGSKIKFIWQSLIDQPLSRIIVLQFIGNRGEWLSEHETTDEIQKNVHAGQTWSDTIYLPVTKEQLKNWKNIGMRLYVRTGNHTNVLPVKNGRADFWNTRLLIPITEKALLTG